MATEKFIQGKKDHCHHDGKASHKRRLDAANADLEFYNSMPTHEILIFPGEGKNVEILGLDKS